MGPDRKLAQQARVQREAELNSGRREEVRTVSHDEFATEELAIMAQRVSQGSVLNLKLALGHFRRICRPGLLADIAPRHIEAFLA